jgi:hypothetical protein
MIKSLTISLAALSAFGVTAASAQSFYGAAELSFGNYSVDDTGSDEGTGNLSTLNAYIGTGFGNGYFAEGEVRLKQASSLSNPGANNGMRDASMYALRVGKEFGAFSLDGFVGQLSATSGDNDDPGDATIQRHFYGLSGGFDISDQTYLSGLIGHLNGNTTGFGSNYDAFSNFSHISVGVDHNFSSSWALSVSATKGWGEMAGLPNNGSVQELGLGVTYTFADPNMHAFAEVRRARYDQTDDGDYAIEDHYSIGFVMAFGNSGTGRTSNRTNLPNYLEWLTASDGHLE